MSCCGNSLFDKNSNGRRIKFVCDATGPSLVVTNGANIVSKIDLCSFNKSYGQFNQTQMYLEAGALNREIPYNIGTQINFLFIKVQYVPKSPVSSFTPFLSTNEIPYLAYTFLTNPNEVRYMDDVMMLTGTDNRRLPKIYLSNPNAGYDAIVTILTSTNSVTYINPNPTNIGDKVITVEKLTYRNLTSDCDNLYVNSTAGTVVTMRWQDITFHSSSGDLELNGKIITIQDYVKGKINLSFVDEYNAKQGYSLIKWALCNRCVNLITGSNPTDDTAPVIHYTSQFTTNIVLANFPPLPASTCGLSGTSACISHYQGTHGAGVILKNDLFKFLVVNATDNRDCFVKFNVNNLTIRPITSTNTIDAITQLGLYQLTFDVSDNAGNLATDSYILNVKDDEAPELVVSTLGLELINLQSGTAGSSTSSAFIPLYPNNYINVPLNANNFNVEFNGSSGDVCYLIFGNIVIEVGSYYNSSAGVIYFTFDNQAVGDNGILQWNTSTEVGVTKVFTLGSNNYNIEWVGFGSFLFSVNLTTTPSINNNFISDENNNFISDENGNNLSF